MLNDLTGVPGLCEKKLRKQKSRIGSLKWPKNCYPIPFPECSNARSRVAIKKPFHLNSNQKTRLPLRFFLWLLALHDISPVARNTCTFASVHDQRLIKANLVPPARTRPSGPLVSTTENKKQKPQHPQNKSNWQRGRQAIPHENAFIRSILYNSLRCMYSIDPHRIKCPYRETKHQRGQPQ